MKRIGWIDDLKGLGIVLIVLGHVVATVHIMSTGLVAERVDAVFRYIYSFHVPFFFLLAGLTFTGKQSFGDFAKKKFLRLMVPYFIWGFVSALLFIVMGRCVVANVGSAAYAGKAMNDAWWVPFVSILHGGRWPDGKGFSFNGVLWFLPVLFLCEIIYYWVAKWLKGTWRSVLLVSAIIAILSPIYWPMIKLHLPYGLSWTIGYLAYMTVGHWIGEVFIRGEWAGEKKNLWQWLAVGMAIVVGWRLCGAMGEVVRYPKLFIYAFATILPLLLVARFGVFRLFAPFAPYTIGIMLFHKFIIIPLQIVGNKLGVMHHCPGLMAVVCIITFTATCLLVTYFTSKAIIRFAPWSLGAKGRYDSRVLGK